MDKKACTISATPCEGKVVLFKNRDRNYDPDIKVYHDRVNGVEILYFQDVDTGWIEGINEYGISLVNSALMVLDDEKDRPSKKKDEYDPDDEGMENLSRILARDSYKDGNLMLEILSSTTLDEAVRKASTNKGVLGHNLLSDGYETYGIERTLKGVLEGEEGDLHVRKLRSDKTHVRTNHGVWNPDTGYQYGVNRDSSHERKRRAQKRIRQIQKVQDLAPSIYGDRLRNPDDPFNVSRRSNLYTSSHTVFDPIERKMYLYLFPDCCGYAGFEKRFSGPAVCSFEIYRYGHGDENGNFEMQEIRSNPVRVASKYLG